MNREQRESADLHSHQPTISIKLPPVKPPLPPPRACASYNKHSDSSNQTPSKTFDLLQPPPTASNQQEGQFTCISKESDYVSMRCLVPAKPAKSIGVESGRLELRSKRNSAGESEGKPHLRLSLSEPWSSSIGSESNIYMDMGPFMKKPTPGLTASKPPLPQRAPGILHKQKTDDINKNLTQLFSRASKMDRRLSNMHLRLSRNCKQQLPTNSLEFFDDITDNMDIDDGELSDDTLADQEQERLFKRAPANTTTELEQLASVSRLMRYMPARWTQDGQCHSLLEDIEDDSTAELPTQKTIDKKNDKQKKDKVKKKDKLYHKVLKDLKQESPKPAKKGLFGKKDKGIKSPDNPLLQNKTKVQHQESINEYVTLDSVSPWRPGEQKQISPTPKKKDKGKDKKKKGKDKTGTQDYPAYQITPCYMELTEQPGGAIYDYVETAPATKATFEAYTVDELVACFNECGMESLASLCKAEKLDGNYFVKNIDDRVLSEPPFSLETFHIVKVKNIIEGFRPKLVR